MKNALAILGVLVFFATASAAYAGEVELLSAQSYRQSNGGVLDSFIKAKVKVKNLAYNKKITFHAQLDNNTWADLDTVGYTVTSTYLYSVSGGYEVWSVNATKNFYITPEFFKEIFTVKYVANGQTYWDNNAGNNYFIGYNGYMLGGNLNVIQYDASAYRTQTNTIVFYGTVLVQKGVSTGRINIVYTTDNWTTTKTASAKFIDPATGASYFQIEIPSFTGTIEYAISYTKNISNPSSPVYWDNNFGLNYKIQMN